MGLRGVSNLSGLGPYKCKIQYPHSLIYAPIMLRWFIVSARTSRVSLDLLTMDRRISSL